MRRALVTGDRGFVGRHLTAHLEAGGDRVFSFDLAYGHDVRSYEHLRGMIERVEPTDIYHLAAQASPRESIGDPRRAFDVNLGGALNLLEAVRQLDSPARVLLVGTSEEYGYENQVGPVTERSPCLPTTPYGASKLAAEALGRSYAARYGVRVVAVRPFNHAGPGQSARYAVGAFARRIIECERGLRPVVEHGDLRAVRNYTDVRDVVRAYRLAVELEPDVYNVCSDQNVTVRHVLHLMVQVAGGDVPLKSNARLSEEASPTWFDPSCERLTTLTGWRPKIPLAETLRDALDWWRVNL